MKTVRKHNTNLLTVDYIDDAETESDKKYLNNIFEILCKNAYCVIVQVQRANYWRGKLLEPNSSYNQILSKFQHILIDQTKYESCFLYQITESNTEFINGCSKLWYEFEDPCFIFITTSNPDDKILSSIYKNYRLAWYDYIKMLECYVVCAIDLCILGIGKSDNLSFDILGDALLSS